MFHRLFRRMTRNPERSHLNDRRWQLRLESLETRLAPACTLSARAAQLKSGSSRVAPHRDGTTCAGRSTQVPNGPLTFLTTAAISAG